jgi:hypothetical protein
VWQVIAPAPLMPSTTQSRRFGHHAADGLDVVADAGAAFHQRAEDGNCVGMRRQEPCHVIGRDGLSPGHRVQNDFDAEPLANLGPAAREHPRLQHDDLAAPRRHVHHGRFHGAGARTGQQQHIVVRLQNILQVAQSLSQ